MELKEFADLMNRKDKLVRELHLNKQRKELKKELRDLKAEWDEMKELRHRLEGVIEKDEAELNFPAKSTTAIPGTESSNLKQRLIKWEQDFKRIFSKAEKERNATDRQYIAKELPILRVEKENLEYRLKKMEEIVAKTSILVDDLNEDYCQELSNGHSLAMVGGALHEEYGRELNADSVVGRKEMRKFLENRFKITKDVSRELFSLLEESGILSYRIVLPKDMAYEPLFFEYSDETGDLAESMSDLYGKWEIKA